MPTRAFRRQIRVIDIEEMCIKDLPDGARYVTLSYPWGGVEQLKLCRENDTTLRQQGSLNRMWKSIPRTIQDFIILVAEVKERYAWVDALAILQDDEDDDKPKQMSQMGRIYQHSHFTVHAVSGSNANYGLPHVRPKPRQFRQLVVRIGDQEISNTLPWLNDEGYDRCGGTWGSRAWTYQERFISQRSVFLGDFGIEMNCWHTASPEDEHCRHAQWHGGKPATGRVIFWVGQDPRCEPYIRSRTTFDSYTQVVSEYTERNLTFQKDALRAFLGVQEYFENNFESSFVHGLPEAEFEAALLWSPVGKLERRRNPETGGALFPSWSWLGWIGPVAWPWQMERDSFMSMENVPLLWQDAALPPPTPRTGSPDGTMYTTASGFANSVYNPCFTSDDTCLPASPTRAQTLRDIARGTDDHLGLRYESDLLRNNPQHANNAMVQWPNGGRPRLQHASPVSHVITFRTVIVELRVFGVPWRRKRLYNMKHVVYRMSVADRDGVLAGYIDVPDLSVAGEPIQPGAYEFAVLSRSSIDGKFDPPPDALQVKRRRRLKFDDQVRDERSHPDNLEYSTAQRNEQGNFNEDVYDEIRPWCMFNVMLVEREWDGMLSRRAIGRVHVDAILISNGGKALNWEVINLV